MSVDLTVGIVGMGTIGATHARALREIEGVAVTAYSGGREGSGADCGWPRARWLDHAQLVERGEVDIVALCSPSALHGPAAITVARSGRHVVVEKPMTLDVAEAETLANLQAEGPGIVAMVSQRRFEPVYRRVHDLLARGELGEIRLATTHVHWYRDQAYFDAAPWRSERSGGGGSLVNQGVHNVDLLQWLCGPVESVTAQTATLALPIAAEDTMVATARFSSGALGLLSTSTATPPGFPATVTVHTSLGMLTLGQGDVHAWEIPGVPAPDAAPAPASGAADPGAIGLAGHVAYWHDVIDAIRTGRAPLVDATEGLAVTRLLRGLYEAADTGRLVWLADLR
ncbi:Gfo/Idh/MocA family protein [Pseudactinotalea sp. HY158]|uniref:Gfo/Idh/MocA family protein n=1 Tax=Pseudactinotalea sp. HY158 TaxID=2654547 RepID=UPI00129C317A|nr:Gfo/Idh/MocA family oxidoreductase [Pseudactinotalea sp. HY158]QGH68791.1 gfo/Idh/MocA family oxidoreductase [Pseudactinotalea sp. HY158]